MNDSDTENLSTLMAGCNHDETRSATSVSVRAKIESRSHGVWMGLEQDHFLGGRHFGK
jgi:hypothetical protein